MLARFGYLFISHARRTARMRRERRIAYLAPMGVLFLLGPAGEKRRAGAVGG